jgi:hypothetical protein
MDDCEMRQIRAFPKEEFKVDFIPAFSVDFFEQFAKSPFWDLG